MSQLVTSCAEERFLFTYFVYLPPLPSDSSSCFVKLHEEAKDTQTEAEPQQAENLDKKQDVNSEGNSHDMRVVTSIPENVAEEEEVESSGRPERGIPSPTWLAQVNKVDEGIQGDVGQVP